MASSLSLLVLACAGTVVSQRHGSVISVPANLSTRVLHPDLYGYSLEPVWVTDYISNDLTKTLVSTVANITGVQPPWRIGGNTADQTFIVDAVLNATAVALPNATSATQLNVTAAWYKAWGTYFSEGTNLTYTLNFRNNESSWENAQAEAAAIWGELGSKLKRFELGNEIDHFINKQWRNSSWGVVPYVQQFRTLTGLLTSSGWYRSAAASAPVFAAGSFADPPWVRDQQDEIDDFDVLNLTTKGGLVARTESAKVDSYVVHMYPQSTCDAPRWNRMRLDLLSNHSVVWANISQYVPQVAAADAAGAPLVMGETNSISCSGRSGISDTLGAALWNVDYTLTLASIGVEHVYFHLGARSEYSSWTPLPYDYKGEHLAAGIRPGWYAHVFVARVVSGPGGYSIAALPAANSSDLSGFGVYSSGGKSLQKLVLLDMGVWNGTEGLSNPSTISAADNVDPAFHSQGVRPVSNMTVTTPWCPGSTVLVTRLSGPGSNAKSGVTVSGASFDPASGKVVSGSLEPTETVKVGSGGVVAFSLTMAEGALLEVVNVTGQCTATVPTSAATHTFAVGWAMAVSLVGMVFLL